ncbi:hypothetical protein SAMN05421684_2886 [Asanoa ishikariensis]|uniref:Uncharacterized protein n=2 Tax=Asanoa ishikariensis TaxID=137265 RepID=A0A1H3PH58_9ACTN|nr:hypothetical protein SAMN05421684_2886 [Asanoa ishikariensis]
MLRRFGDRDTFAVEVGDFDGGLRVVDLWAGGRRLTVKDNFAYVPQFCLSMRHTIEDVRGGAVPSCPYPGHSPEENFRLLFMGDEEFREKHWFMHWGPTTDNLTPYAYLQDGELVLVIRFWGEETDDVVVARIAPDQFVATVEAAADLLERESPRSERRGRGAGRFPGVREAAQPPSAVNGRRPRRAGVG